MKFLIPFRIYASGWLTVLGCLAIGFWAGGWKLGAPMGAMLIVSLLLHEAGHMLMATLLGVKVHEFGLRLAGAYNRRERASRRSHEVLISLAGPLTNLCLVIPCLFIHRIGGQLALDNLALCVVNLMPIPSSDGLRILKTIWRPGKINSVMPALGEPAVG